MEQIQVVEINFEMVKMMVVEGHYFEAKMLGMRLNSQLAPTMAVVMKFQGL